MRDVVALPSYLELPRVFELADPQLTARAAHRQNCAMHMTEEKKKINKPNKIQNVTLTPLTSLRVTDLTKKHVPSTFSELRTKDQKRQNVKWSKKKRI